LLARCVFKLRRKEAGHERSSVKMVWQTIPDDRRSIAESTSKRRPMAIEEEKILPVTRA